MPSQLGLLTSMTAGFKLNSNALGSPDGILPTELGMLSLMADTFSLASNKLSATIPTELGQVSYGS